MKDGAVKSQNASKAHFDHNSSKSAQLIHKQTFQKHMRNRDDRDTVHTKHSAQTKMDIK